MKINRTSALLVSLFLLPWGIQYIVQNFMPIYIESLPFADEKTVGWAIGIGSVVTVVFQILWTAVADRSNNKPFILAVSSFLLAVFSLMFAIVEINNFTKLIVIIILFYSCYMVHQPLIDTIGVEKCSETKRSFGWFRSFASLSYGCTGVLLIVAPIENSRFLFFYTSVLALATGTVALFIRGNKSNTIVPAKHNKSINFFNPSFIKFLAYTFFLFISSSAINTFFPLIFKAENGINGDLKFFTFVVGLGAFMEWGVIIVLSKRLLALKANLSFVLLTLSQMLRSVIIYFAADQYTATISLVFSTFYSGITWSVSTPYLKSIIPENQLASAQGLWTVVAFGIAPFVGSTLCGQLTSILSLKDIFLWISLYLVALCILTYVFFIDKKELKN